jgi:hypothetical protein
MDEAAARESGPSWEFLSTFHVPESLVPRPATWGTFDTWFRLAAQAADAQRQALEHELEPWDERLVELGGDPSRTDFTDFRPLRTSREEDWSDWLQHLLRSARSGDFARHLLGRSQAHPDARRELECAGGAYRADLVVFWTDAAATHVEVKVGDLQFEKTWATADALEAEHPRIREWMHFILLPDEHLGLWHQTARNRNRSRHIETLTWGDVTLALRRTLLRTEEPMSWRVWAWTYCGAIEQRLLGMPRYESGLSPASASTLLRYLNRLRTRP